MNAWAARCRKLPHERNVYELKDDCLHTAQWIPSTIVQHQSCLLSTSETSSTTDSANTTYQSAGVYHSAVLNIQSQPCKHVTAPQCGPVPLGKKAHLRARLLV